MKRKKFVSSCFLLLGLFMIAGCGTAVTDTTTTTAGSTTTSTAATSTTTTTTTSTTTTTTTTTTTSTTTTTTTTTSTTTSTSSTSTSTTTTTTIATQSISGTVTDLSFGLLSVYASTSETFADVIGSQGSSSPANTTAYIATGETAKSYTITGLSPRTYYVVAIILDSRWQPGQLQAGDYAGEYFDGKLPSSFTGIFSNATGTPSAVVISSSNVNNINISPLCDKL